MRPPKYIDELRPRLAIQDLSTPKMDGSELARQFLRGRLFLDNVSNPVEGHYRGCPQTRGRWGVAIVGVKLGHTPSVRSSRVAD
jgi:hypothetical protein